MSDEQRPITTRKVGYRFAPGHKQATGGARPGSGRKSTFAHQQKQEALDKVSVHNVQIGDTTHTIETSPVGLAMFIVLETMAGRATMRQFWAAKDILDRAWGKAHTSMTITGEMRLSPFHHLDAMLAKAAARQVSVVDHPSLLEPPPPPTTGDYKETNP
jgi:hypothetical protein